MRGKRSQGRAGPACLPIAKKKKTETLSRPTAEMSSLSSPSCFIHVSCADYLACTRKVGMGSHGRSPAWTREGGVAQTGNQAVDEAENRTSSSEGRVQRRIE